MLPHTVSTQIYRRSNFRLILEFCTDLCTFLLSNKSSSAAVHCKAGKGRTGIMICSYLLFSGLASNSKEALALYAERRSYKLRGVEVPSQIRYLQHFETFLNLTFQRPYFKQIPKLFRVYCSRTSNLLEEILSSKSKLYFQYGNVFKIHRIKIGPFREKSSLDLVIRNFNKEQIFNSGTSNTTFKFCIREETTTNRRSRYTSIFAIYEFVCNDKLRIESDSEFTFSGTKANFFFWINLFYVTLEKYLDIISELISKGLIPINFNRGNLNERLKQLEDNKKASNESDKRKIQNYAKGSITKSNIKEDYEPYKRTEVKVSSSLENKKTKEEDPPYSSKTYMHTTYQSPSTYSRLAKTPSKRQNAKAQEANISPVNKELSSQTIDKLKDIQTQKKKSLFLSPSENKYLDSSLSNRNDPIIKGNIEGKRFENIEKVKIALYKNSDFLGDFIQSSNLNSIHNYLISKFPSEINSDKIFRYTFNKKSLDKISTNEGADFKVELIYQLVSS